jgi:hypothetical protein
MKAFVVCVLLLLVIPMVALNPLGRDAFLGYYVGMVAMWATVALVGSRAVAKPTM